MSDLNIMQSDRAAGVLLAQACGDALGVPYEFGLPPGPGELAEMKGGGLGGFEPGEWSDDTAMAVAVAEGLLAHSEDAIAEGFLRWYDANPPDIGIQTRSVLSRVSRGSNRGDSLGDRMRVEAAGYAQRNERSAGNGALMRTSAVALAHLRDREACARAARSIAELTHADPLAGDSCVLWSEAIRRGVLDGAIDVAAGLDLVPRPRREEWRTRLDEALSGPPARFSSNGFTVTALQAALAAIVHTPGAEGHHLREALQSAVRIGNDTDTVAAIAGGLLGACWGAAAVPRDWRGKVHGWPGRDGEDLVALSGKLVEAGAG